MTTKVRTVKAMVFPVVMYRCESWTVKKAECQRTDASELWCWRRLLRVPWTASRLKQSVLKEINPEYSWKDWSWGWSSDTWCKELTHWKRSWCWDRLTAEEEGNRWDCWMASPIQWTWVWANSRRWWGTMKPGIPQSTGLRRVAHNLVTEQQSTYYVLGTGALTKKIVLLSRSIQKPLGEG